MAILRRRSADGITEESNIPPSTIARATIGTSLLVTLEHGDASCVAPIPVMFVGRLWGRWILNSCASDGASGKDYASPLK